MESRKGKGIARSQEGRLSSHLEGTLKKIENLEKMRNRPGKRQFVSTGKINRLALQACFLSVKLYALERHIIE